LSINSNLNGFKVTGINVPANSSDSITLNNNGRYLIVCLGATINIQELILASVTGSGTITHVQVLSASQISITKATNTLTIANSSTSQLAVRVLGLNSYS